jgi:hypothetical protein
LPIFAVLVVAFASRVAAAEDHENHHHLPPEYQDLQWSMPPASGIAPEYPLAAQFVEADGSNFTAGGLGTVQYVVVHTMQGSYEGSINWFLNPASDVSAHFCMRSDDGEITQMVGLDDRAWHVGSSNTVAIGIEHEGFVDDASWYTFAMYDASAKLARWLADRFGLPLDREHIVGHVELPNQTHTDPGGNWDWDLYMALVHDVGGDAVVEAVVVDPSRACELVASSDTWITRSRAAPGELGDGEKCLIAAGDAVRYVHAGPDRAGRRHLALVDDGACAIAEGFADTAAFAGFCPDASLVVPGAAVTLDGGAPLIADAEGRVTWTGVAAGAHELAASVDGFDATGVAIDHAGYPGTRVVLRLEPIHACDTTVGDPSTADDSGEPPGDTGDAGLDTDAGTSEGPPDAPGDPDAPALPDTFGESDEVAGCGCAAPRAGRPSLPGLSFMTLGLVAVFCRRRR